MKLMNMLYNCYTNHATAFALGLPFPMFCPFTRCVIPCQACHQLLVIQTVCRHLPPVLALSGAPHVLKCGSWHSVFDNLMVHYSTRMPLTCDRQTESWCPYIVTLNHNCAYKFGSWTRPLVSLPIVSTFVSVSELGAVSVCGPNPAGSSSVSDVLEVPMILMIHLHDPPLHLYHGINPTNPGQ